MWNSLPIRHKLALVIGGALLLSVLISTVIGNNAMRSMVTGRIELQEIPATLDAVANAIEKEINIPIAISRAMAQNSYVESFQQQGEPQEQIADITTYLKAMKDQNNAITSYLVSGPSKGYYTNEGYARAITETGDPWFYGFINSNQDYALNISTGKQVKKLTLFINYRTNNGHSITGLGMDIDSVAQMIRNYKLGETGKVMIADEQGLIQIHPDQHVSPGTSMNEYLADSVSDKLFNKDKTSVLESEGNGHYLMASKYLPELNWYVVAQVPAKELYGPINTTSLQLVVINLVVVAILIMAGFWVALGVARPVIKAANMLDLIASGDADLTKTMPEVSKDEVGKLATSFNRFVGQLRFLIKAITENVQQVHDSSDELVKSAHTTESNTQNQQQSVDMVAAAINQMGATVQEIAKIAHDTADAAKQAAVDSQDGQGVVNQTVSGINSLFEKMQGASDVIETLAQDVGEISSVLEVIRGISEQTNLLALNAAIEAARAGEQGRGFAVVADEVRTLAQRTQESTEEINTMIQKLQGGAKDAVSAMSTGMENAGSSVESADTAGQSLAKITQAIDSISDLSIQVATATEQQSSVVEELNNHILNIKTMSDNNAEESHHMTDKCKKLIDSSASLNKMISNFKT